MEKSHVIMSSQRIEKKKNNHTCMYAELRETQTCGIIVKWFPLATETANAWL